jgi:hypothetical protein
MMIGESTREATSEAPTASGFFNRVTIEPSSDGRKESERVKTNVPRVVRVVYVRGDAVTFGESNNRSLAYELAARKKNEATRKSLGNPLVVP